MDVQVMRREEAVRYSFHPQNEESVVISISTPGLTYGTKVFPSPYNGIKAVLLLFFDDVESGPDSITVDDARKIRSFLEANKGYKVIVHCDAGISRSAGVAAAIMKHYNGDDTPIFDNPRYVPNMRCYRKMLEELEGSSWKD